MISWDQRGLLEGLSKIFIIEGDGSLDCFLGAKNGLINGYYDEKGRVISTWSANIYLNDIINKTEEIYGNVRTKSRPMDPDYDLELVKSEL